MTEHGYETLADSVGAADRTSAIAKDLARAWQAVLPHLSVLGILTAAVVTATAVAVTWRTKRALRSREALRVVPTLSFAPSLDEVRRWAAGLAATRRSVGGFWSRRGEAVRIRLGNEDDGRVCMYLEGTPRTLRLAEAAGLREVELQRVALEHPDSWSRRAMARLVGTIGTGGREAGGPQEVVAAQPPPLSLGGEGLGLRPASPRVARREMRLAAKTHLPLQTLDLASDPLAPFVAALGGLAVGEDAEVILDLAPLSRRQRHRLHRAAQRGDHGPNTDGLAGLAAELNTDPTSSRGGRIAARSRGINDLERMEDRDQDRATHTKLASAEAAFRTQVLLRASAPTRARARALVETLALGFAPFAGRNSWRATGLALGFAHLGGAQSFWNRARFDNRWRNGLFWPTHTSVVTAGEIAGLIKPPTKLCPGSNIARSGGLVPDPPVGLPDWTPETAELMPLGHVLDRGEWRIKGVPWGDTLFSASFGRAGWGKTEKAIVAAVGLARSGVGVVFNDPHGDALARLTPYLLGQAERLLEVNLARATQSTQAGWNPLDMGGSGGEGPDAIEERTSMVAASFAATLGWTEQNTRGLNLVTQAAQSLCELNRNLPPDLQATLFQIVDILSDDDWRAEVLPFLSENLRKFWLNRFTKQTGGGEAITPVTNALDRLRASRHVAALFGQSHSTFNMRAAMDEGKIVLLCPGGVGDKEDLIHTLFLFELFRAVMSRRDTPAKDRRPVHAFLDELQVADRGQGSLHVARFVQEARKFGGRLHVMAQQPTSLSARTLTAIFTNRSHLMATAVDAGSALALSREWGNAVTPETVTGQPRYHYLASVTTGGDISPPFKVRGLSVEEAFGPAPGAEALAQIDRAIDTNMDRRPVDQVLADLDALPERIVEFLRHENPLVAAAKAGLATLPQRIPRPARRAPVGTAGATVSRIHRDPGQETRYE